jgi:hypothetical protein
MVSQQELPIVMQGGSSAVLQHDWDPHMTHDEVILAQGLPADLQMPVPSSRCRMTSRLIP